MTAATNFSDLKTFGNLGQKIPQLQIHPAWGVEGNFRETVYPGACLQMIANHPSNSILKNPIDTVSIRKSVIPVSSGTYRAVPSLPTLWSLSGSSSSAITPHQTVTAERRTPVRPAPSSTRVNSQRTHHWVSFVHHPTGSDKSGRYSGGLHSSLPGILAIYLGRPHLKRPRTDFWMTAFACDSATSYQDTERQA